MGMGLDTFANGNTTVSNDNDGVFSDWPTLTSASGYVRHYGEYMYKLSNRANIVVDMIDENPDIEYSTPTMKQELRAEAVFLRAWSYRILAGLFGSLVYSDHMTQEARYDYEMIPREEAWKFIAADFEYAEQNLPTTARLMGTVTKAAAAHYLAETYLSLGQFAEAEAAASRVINGQDGDYHLMTTRFGNRADGIDQPLVNRVLAVKNGSHVHNKLACVENKLVVARVIHRGIFNDEPGYSVLDPLEILEGLRHSYSKPRGSHRVNCH